MKNRITLLKIFMFQFFFFGILIFFHLNTTYAETFPNHVVKIIVPYLSGGSADAQVRFLATELQSQWGQPVVIENKPGAGTTVGAAYVAASKADGYTLYVASTSHTITPSLYKNLSYDAVYSYEPITMISSSPFLVSIKADSPLNSVQDLINLAKSNPGKMSWSSSGVGGGPHLSGEILKSTTSVNTIHIPFNGFSPSVNAVIGGHVDYVFSDITVLNLIRSGELKALAVTSPQRSSLLPNIPTFIESGFPSVQILNWSSILAPAGTPKEITNFLNNSISLALKKASIKEKYEKLGFIPQGSNQEDLLKFLKSEVEKYSEIIRSAKIQL